MEDDERRSLSNGKKVEEPTPNQEEPESSSAVVVDLLDIGEEVENYQSPCPPKGSLNTLASKPGIEGENIEVNGPSSSLLGARPHVHQETTTNTAAPAAAAAAAPTDSQISMSLKTQISSEDASVNCSVVKPEARVIGEHTAISLATTSPQEIQEAKAVANLNNNRPPDADQLPNSSQQQASNNTFVESPATQPPPPPTSQGRPPEIEELQRTKAINAELERQNKTLRDQLKTVQQQFDRQLAARSQAEQSSAQAHDTIQQLRTELETTKESLKTAQTQTTTARQRQAKLEQDLEQLRVEYDDHQQLKMSLEVRLNEVRKVEAAEANLVEQYEDDLKAAFGDLEATREELERLKRDHADVQQQQKFAEQRVEETKSHFETLLEDEKKKNELRKAKMKSFVDKKTEELRQSKEDCENLQNEIAQTNHSLLDMDKRWKQLHAQWTQAQTRNRELQRDLNRIKKDSENLHKQGDTLEMKLSRSANETEEHKNKRLAAKQELMSVLRTLDAERDSTSRLCQRVKFTVAPRILEQQQMLDDSSSGLDGALHRLALRSGKPMPASQSDCVHESDKRSRENGNSNSEPIHIEGTSNTELLATIEKLDEETKRVSRVTASVVEQVERLRGLVDSMGDRSCFTVLSELVSTGSIASSPAALQNHAHNISSVLPAIRGRTQGYGQVPHISEHS